MLEPVINTVFYLVALLAKSNDALFKFLLGKYYSEDIANLVTTWEVGLFIMFFLIFLFYSGDPITHK